MNIGSITDFCLQVYGPALKIEHLQRLEKIKYFAAGLVKGTMKYTSISRLYDYDELGWEANEREFLSVSHFHRINSKMLEALSENVCLL